MFPNLARGYGLDLNVCEPYNVSNPNEGCIKPWNADSVRDTVQHTGLGHGWSNAHQAYDNGSMDGFVMTQYESGRNGTDSMSYYTGSSLPDYWDYASYYALDANFFESALQSSYTNHLFEVAAQAQEACALGSCKAETNLTYATIINELNATGINWKYYSGTWDSNKNDCTSITQREAQQNIWNPLIEFPAVQLSYSTCKRIQTLPDLFRDLSKAYLPQVAWIAPNITVSEHPGKLATLEAGQLFTVSIINAISSSPLWNSTAIFLSWDDFGGYYDGVVPQQVDQFGYGFRAPLIVISPYVIKNSIFYGNPAGTQEDFSAFLSTIEYNWGLKNLTNRDGRDAPLFYMFNFSQKPLPPLILPQNALASYPLASCADCRIGFGMQPIIVKDPPHYQIVSVGSSYLPTPNDEGDPYD